MSENHSSHTLEQALQIIEALTPLLIRSGIGFNEFASACKPVFYRQALKEAEQTNQKPTDSAISLLSGLHRRDTASLRKAIAQDPYLANPPISKPVSVPKQVIARWLSKTTLGNTIEVSSEDKNKTTFASLVADVSKDQHFRSILTELERIGIVTTQLDNQKETATLVRTAFTPDPSHIEARELFAQNVSDHISAGILNLFADIEKGETGVLEQAIFSDELSIESVKELHTLTNQLWFSTLETILKRAIELYEQDKVTFNQVSNNDSQNELDTPTPETYRFRLGMYAYHEQEAHNTPLDNEKDRCNTTDKP